MSNHENAQDIESQRQHQQSAHESDAFEQSDAAKVAAVAAVLDEVESAADRWETCGHEWLSFNRLRAALGDPDAALAAVRAEARAEALWDAADEVDGFGVIPTGITDDYWQGWTDGIEKARDILRAKAVTPDV